MIRGKWDNRAVIAFTFLFIFLLGLSKIANYDIWLHLSVGRYILETGAVNHPVDPFSYTSTNPMTTTSWLADIVFYVTHKLFDVGGLVLLKAVFITLLFFVLYINMKLISPRFPHNRYIFIFILLIAAFAMKMRMFVRPFIFEYLLLGLYFFILHLFRFRNKNYLYCIPLLQVLWVNVHPSNIIGILVLFLFLACESIKYIFKWGNGIAKKQLLQLAFITILTIAASFAGPSGYKVFSFPFLLTGQDIYMANVDEWQPLKMALLTGYGFRYTWAFSLLTALSVLMFLFKRKTLDLTETAIFLIFLVLAVKRIRLIPEFVIAVSPIIAGGWSEIVSRQVYLKKIKINTRIINWSIILCLSIVFYTSVLNSKTYTTGLGLKERIFPERAVDFLIENNIHGNMYNSRGYGGYLIWRFQHNQKVFIDGRNEVFEEKLYKDYLDAHSSPAVWKRLVHKYNIDWVILEYSRDYGKKERIHHLADNRNWALIYWDRVAMVYAKRDSLNDNIIKNNEYKYARPSDLNPGYLKKYLKWNTSEKIIQEFKRNLEINPDNEESHLSLAYIYFMLGMHNKELEEMKEVVEINPDIGFAHSSLGELYMKKGDKALAAYEFKEALIINPEDKVAIAGLKKLGKK